MRNADLKFTTAGDYMSPITTYEVQFRITAHYDEAYYDKTVLITEKYAGDNYDDVILAISDDIENENFDFEPVLNPEANALPIAVEIDYVQIVNEYGELEYLNEDKIEA
jgi:hypothetical protein